MIKAIVVLALVALASAAGPSKDVQQCPQKTKLDSATKACIDEAGYVIYYIPDVGYYYPYYGYGYYPSAPYPSVPGTPGTPYPYPGTPGVPYPYPGTPGTPGVPYPYPGTPGVPYPYPGTPGVPYPYPGTPGVPYPYPVPPTTLTSCLSYSTSVCPHGSSVNVLLPHPSDPSHFCQCANGTPVDQECAPGTVFDPVLQVCD